VLTACHVVKHEEGLADAIEVRYKAAPRVPYAAHVLACDEKHDVAALALDDFVAEGVAEGLPKLALARVKQPVQQGLTVKTISHPGDKLWHEETHRLISATDDDITFERASTEAGSSGGAVLSRRN